MIQLLIIIIILERGGGGGTQIFMSPKVEATRTSFNLKQGYALT